MKGLHLNLYLGFWSKKGKQNWMPKCIKNNKIVVNSINFKLSLYTVALAYFKGSITVLPNLLFLVLMYC